MHDLPTPPSIAISDRPATRPPTRHIGAAATLLGMLFFAASVAAQSNGPVTVGAAGRGANCTTASLQEAIDLAKRPEWDDIILISNDLDDRFFDGGTLSIDDQAVDIRGGFADCFQTPSHWAVISGEGGGRGSVFSIRGHSRVWLSGVEIILGDGGLDDDGGGIDFKGTGSLTLGSVHLQFNRAAYGGGMLVKGDGGRLTVDVEANVFIADNEAFFNGGGIHASGDVVLNMTSNGLGLFRNQALGAVRPGAGFEGGYGGGLYLKAPADTNLQALAFSGFPVFLQNLARHGGALAIVGSEDTELPSRARLSSFGFGPLVLAENRALVSGGAVYTRSEARRNGTSEAVLCAHDTAFRANKAPDGAAIYSAVDDGGLLAFDAQGDIHINTGGDGSNACAPPPNPCPPGTVCSEFRSNETVDADGRRTHGAIIEFPDGGDAYPNFTNNRTVYVDNNAGSLIHVGDNDNSTNYVIIRNCLMVRNVLTRPVIDSDAGWTYLRHCTIADNLLAGDHVLRIVESGSDARRSSLTNSIIAQPGIPTLDHEGPREQTVINHVMATEIATLPADETNFIGNPAFVGAPDDYRLGPTSDAIDAAPSTFFGTGGNGEDGWREDLLRLGRTVDYSARPNPAGKLRDLGALEAQNPPSEPPLPVLLRDGFEGGPPNAHHLSGR